MQSTIEDLSAKLVSGIAALVTSNEYGEFADVADARLGRCRLAFDVMPAPNRTRSMIEDEDVELSKYQQLTLMVHNLVTNLVTEVKQQVKLEMRMEMLAMLSDHAITSAPDDVSEDTEATILDFIDVLQVQSLSNLDTQ